MSFTVKTVAVIATLFLAGPIMAETAYPITRLDGMGQTLTLDRQPQKISSKTLFTDEVLTAILEPERLSSITSLASDANFSNIADQLPVGLAQLDFYVEPILNNYPDLVFAANWSEVNKVAQLRQAGIPVYLVDTPFTLAAIEAEIAKLGELLNRTDQASALIASMHRDLALLTDQKTAIAAQQWVALDYNSWGTASGVNTTWQAILDAVGLINGSAAYEQGDFGQVAMSKELIVEIDPDILFLPAEAEGDNSAGDSFYQQVIHDPALADVTAVKNRRIYPIPAALRGTYSQYIVRTITYVTERLSRDLP
ncbi:ABC transporter substrate-binding protein [Reinekea sp.]|jgi:iron complex transport system substrate-binding protein|uniref:ABC transporter substrate-binding protein n=1 Tax=Reinekea sp. TaxID=1970455 RepID=UPI002A7EDBEA|nr:ABC transporter substrate-binding protein [Reinekea sp.]